MAAVSGAVVVDVEAELLPHGNGVKWVRLVLKPEDAEHLLDKLRTAHYEGKF